MNHANDRPHPTLSDLLLDELLDFARDLFVMLGATALVVGLGAGLAYTLQACGVATRLATGAGLASMVALDFLLRVVMGGGTLERTLRPWQGASVIVLPLWFCACLVGVFALVERHAVAGLCAGFALTLFALWCAKDARGLTFYNENLLALAPLATVVVQVDAALLGLTLLYADLGLRFVRSRGLLASSLIAHHAGATFLWRFPLWSLAALSLLAPGGATAIFALFLLLAFGCASTLWQRALARSQSAPPRALRA